MLRGPASTSSRPAHPMLGLGAFVGALRRATARLTDCSRALALFSYEDNGRALTVRAPNGSSSAARAAAHEPIESRASRFAGGVLLGEVMARHPQRPKECLLGLSTE